MKSQEILNLLKMVWPIIVLQYGIMIWALIDLLKNKKTKNLSVVVWVLLIIFLNLVGPILYFLIGRSEE